MMQAFCCNSMRRHQVAIDRDTENLSKARAVCGLLAENGTTMEDLNAEAVLTRMEQMEQEGTTFMNKQKDDVRRRYVAPIVCAILMTVLMIGLIWLMVWGFQEDPAGAPPMIPDRAAGVQRDVVEQPGAVVHLLRLCQYFHMYEALSSGHLFFPAGTIRRNLMHLNILLSFL